MKKLKQLDLMYLNLSFSFTGNMFSRTVISFLLLFSLNVGAQDLHFSQYYSNPLSLNPALTGNFAEDFRISSIYRNQWKSIHSTFETISLGTEVNFKGGKLKNDVVGVGLGFYRDNLGDNMFISQTFLLSGGYHKPLDAHRRHWISGGVQLGYVQKSIDGTKLLYADQFEDFKVNSNIASADAMLNNQSSYATINAGVYYSFDVTPRSKIFTGASVFQLNSPKEAFVAASNNKINPRYSLYAGSNHKISPAITLSPRVLLMNQENAMDVNPGAYLGYDINKLKGITLYLGGWYRTTDAAIIMGGMKWKNYTVRGSYDATVSGLSKMKGTSNIKTNAKTGAYEISFIMVGKLSKAFPDSFTIPCGIF